MKKVFLTLIAMLLVVPVIVFAENKIKVRIPDKNDSNITEVTNEETGVITKSFPVYVEQTEPVTIESVTIAITEKGSGITSLSFNAAAPYTASQDGDNGTFAVGSGQTGASGNKILVGYVVVTVNSAADDCGFKYTPKVNGVKTGAYVSYVALGAGVLLVAGLYTATKSKKKMYNI